MTGERSSTGGRRPGGRPAAGLLAAGALVTAVGLAAAVVAASGCASGPGSGDREREAAKPRDDTARKVASASPPGQQPAARAPAARGLTTRLVVSADGKLLRDGKVYRGIGVNYCDLFQTLIRNGDDRRTLEGLAFLAGKRIPFVRFWACGFWPKDWDLYFGDRDEWFRRLDLVVRTAEERGIGLVPSLFWRTATYPDLFAVREEYNRDWGEPGSRTREFMRTYVREVVARYADSPAIWGWEFANELNLTCDLPNGMQQLGRAIPQLGVNVERDERNLMTYEIAGRAWSAFAREVRKLDPHRFVTTGNSRPRESSWHNAVEKSWKDDDADEAFEAFGWMSPEETNVVSVHFYATKGKRHRYAGAEGIAAVIARYREFATRINKPLFLGEFSAHPAEKGGEITKEEFRALLTEILDAVVRERVDLAAYWVFDYTADRKGVGLVRKGNEWEFVLDLIAGYNRKIGAKLAGEGRSGRSE